LKKLIALSLAFMLLLPLCRSLRPQEDGKQWIERIATAYEGFPSYYLEGTAQIRIDGFRKTVRSERFEQYAKPKENKFLHRAGTGNSTLVIAADGNSVAAYFGGSRQYVQNPSSDDRAAFESLFNVASDFHLGPAFPGSYTALKSKLRSARILRREKVLLKSGPVDCIVVEVETVPEEGALPQTLTIRTLWIDPAGGIVLKDVVHSQTLSSKGKTFIDSVAEMQLSSYRMNEEMTDSIFQFRPPANAQIAERLDLDAMDAGLTIGSPTLSMPLSALDGRRYTFEELRGNVVVLDFWATWCAPCVKEMGSLEKSYRLHKDKGLAVFGVNRETAQLQRDFLKKKKFSYPMLLDGNGALTERFDAVNLPTTVLIDRKGRIAAWEQGLLKEKELESLLGRLGIE
jgi:cytochrome c biogenesis protein CcmG/thiol:disulfide interchange protein DsbE